MFLGNHVKKLSGAVPHNLFAYERIERNDETMMDGLDLQKLPMYHASAHKVFRPGEKHVRRIAGEDVLILMLEGTLHFLENGEQIDLEKGEYYIQRKGLLQEGRIPSDDARYYYIHFTGAYGQSQQTLPLRGTGDFSTLLPVFDALDFLQLSGASAVEKSALFYRILSGICKKERQTQHKQVVMQIMMMIQENIRHPFTLDELAERCGYSPNSIITFFREETGQTPFSFLQKARIEAAKRQLSDSDLPVGIIAEECGFSGYVNFYKSFVKLEGIAPLEWRKLRRGCRAHFPWE